jgi:hypothetical protein
VLKIKGEIVRVRVRDKGYMELKMLESGFTFVEEKRLLHELEWCHELNNGGIEGKMLKIRH